MTRRFFKILYQPRHYIEKAFWFAICTVNRILDVGRALFYDVVFVHRESYPLGGPFFESVLRKMKKPIIFDFDDAIFLPNTSEENARIKRLKHPDKVPRIIALCDHTIAGNSYLESFALKFTKNVTIIPSCVDTEIYRPKSEGRDRKGVTIGWVGSTTTRNFLYDLEGVFEEISKSCGDVAFKFVGAHFAPRGAINVINAEWSLEDESVEIQGFDIGIMPMPDNEWTRGKCGFKALLYMACGVPVVASPVGVNREIIEDGVNGFLARTDREWVAKLSALIKDAELRRRLGMAGRQTAERRYSLKVHAPRFEDVLRLR